MYVIDCMRVYEKRRQSKQTEFYFKVLLNRYESVCVNLSGETWPLCV